VTPKSANHSYLRRNRATDAPEDEGRVSHSLRHEYVTCSPVYIHKEEALADVERRYPAAHYVVMDDKVRILAAIKKAWGERVTSVFPCQGKFAHDPKVLGAFPVPDVTVERIGDLLAYELYNLVGHL
jgi:hypothetical protein